MPETMTSWLDMLRIWSTASSVASSDVPVSKNTAIIVASPLLKAS